MQMLELPALVEMYYIVGFVRMTGQAPSSVSESNSHLSFLVRPVRPA